MMGSQCPSAKSQRESHGLRIINRIDKNFINATVINVRFSKSFARRRHRFNHAKVRSTTQRLANTSKPFAVSERFTNLMARPGMAVASAA